MPRALCTPTIKAFKTNRNRGAITIRGVSHLSKRSPSAESETLAPEQSSLCCVLFPRRYCLWCNARRVSRHIALTIALFSFRRDPALMGSAPRNVRKTFPMVVAPQQCELVCPHYGYILLYAPATPSPQFLCKRKNICMLNPMARVWYRHRHADASQAICLRGIRRPTNMACIFRHGPAIDESQVSVATSPAGQVLSVAMLPLLLVRLQMQPYTHGRNVRPSSSTHGSRYEIKRLAIEELEITEDRAQYPRSTDLCS